MNGHKIRLKFTVGVGEDSLQPRDEFCGPAFIRPQEKSLLIVVISMNIVPDDRSSPQYLCDFFNRFNSYVFRNYLGTCQTCKSIFKIHERANYYSSPLNENTTYLSTAPQYQEAAFHLLYAGKATVAHLDNKMFHNTLRTRKHSLIMRRYIIEIIH